MSTIFQEFSFFYPRDAPDFDSVKRQILLNGGTLVSLPEVASVRLAVPGQAVAEDGYDVDSSFLEDSISQGVPGNLDLYRIFPELGEALIVGERFLRDRNWVPVRNVVPSTKPKPSAPIHSAADQPEPTHRSTEAEEVPVQAPQRTEEVSGMKRTFGRMNYQKDEYSLEEDMTLIDHVNKHRGIFGMSPNGQNLWKKAEANKLLGGRTWQSMEGRWKKQIRPRWPHFRAAYRDYSGQPNFELL